MKPLAADAVGIFTESLVLEVPGQLLRIEASATRDNPERGILAALGQCPRIAYAGIGTD